jgi:hypothetical protein
MPKNHIRPERRTKSRPIRKGLAVTEKTLLVIFTKKSLKLAKWNTSVKT